MSFTQSPKSTMNFRSKSGYLGTQVPVSTWDSLQQKYYSSFQKQYCFGRVNEPLPPKMLNKQFIQSLISQGAEHTGETKRAPIEFAIQLFTLCSLVGLQAGSQCPQIGQSGSSKQPRNLPQFPGTNFSFHYMPMFSL